ncbi:hypothetical protein Ae201684P_019750 [Aphanomyces euteiches]|nr:hypothetical protein Ae201684P_019750 [Aphanomyces euteiches]
MASKSSGKTKPPGSQSKQLTSQSDTMSAFQAALNTATAELATELENHAQRVVDVFHGASCSLTDLPSLAHAALDILANSQRLLRRGAREWIQDSRTRQEFITATHPLLLRTGQQRRERFGYGTSDPTESRLDAQGRQIDALEAQLKVLSRAQQPGSQLSTTADAVNSSEAATPSVDQDDDIFSAPISPVVDDSNDSDYDDEVVIVENPDHSKKHWVYEDKTSAEVQRFRQAMEDGLCDHRYHGLADQHCTKPRSECIERKLGNHGDQCRWITTKHMARCKASIKQCSQHRQWALQPPPGKLFHREFSVRPKGVEAQSSSFVNISHSRRSSPARARRDRESSSLGRR